MSVEIDPFSPAAVVHFIGYVFVWMACNAAVLALIYRLKATLQRNDEEASGLALAVLLTQVLGSGIAAFLVLDHETATAADAMLWARFALACVSPGMLMLGLAALYGAIHLVWCGLDRVRSQGYQPI